MIKNQENGNEKREQAEKHFLLHELNERIVIKQKMKSFKNEVDFIKNQEIHRIEEESNKRLESMEYGIADLENALEVADSYRIKEALKNINLP